MLTPAALMWDCFDMPHVSLADARLLPPSPGVYVVYHDEAVLYVGQTQNLRHRWQNHHRVAQCFTYGPHVEIAWQVLTECDAATRKAIETALIAFWHPQLNREQFQSASDVMEASPRPRTVPRGTNHLEILRRARRISRYAFARAMNVSATTIWRWEQEKVPIALCDLLRMAQILQVAPTDILPELTTVPIATPVHEETSL